MYLCSISYIAAGQRLYETAVVHTTKGDIHLKLFPKECPKTVENFCVHAKNGYFNGHIFHRVIKQFMIQTGDPTGTIEINCLSPFSFILGVAVCIQV